MPVAKVTKDDSAIPNVQKPAHFIRSRSCGDFSTFDPAFDNAAKRAIEKRLYAKRFRSFMRQMALLSVARNLLSITALACIFIRIQSLGNQENQEQENQEKPAQLPFLISYLYVPEGVGNGLSLVDLGYTFLLWYYSRRMYGQWFFSADSVREDMWLSVGCSESAILKLVIDLQLAVVIVATVSMVMLAGIIEFSYPGFFLALWFHVICELWHYNTVNVALYESYVVLLPCVGLAVCSCITTWKCRRVILQFRQIFWAEMQADINFDPTDCLYRNFLVFFYRARHIVLNHRSFWSVIWMLSLIFSGEEKSSAVMTED
ncbi:uncharacterized protein LOC129599856 [Paramacrobiotus metropolitanus]|uniref:uncharacterized protein LOC129599856 n=1 Tax=Paramacrobiotus metropolitanus TaxID=2943436 RepID=UPI0024462413|nr:uncharacterized protein LOC129599856 [Paramacrobiotus metropolitanus]